MQTMDRKTGLTLVEVLLVVALLGFVVVILLPALISPLGPHEKSHVLAKGRTIHQHIFSTITDIGYTGQINFYAEHDSERYDTSTEYFKWLMDPELTNDELVMPQDFRLFSNQDVPAALYLTEFDEGHNIWSVVTGLTATSEASEPFLITRNLNEPKLVDWGTDQGLKLGNVGRGDYWTPYGDETIIVVRSGGGGDILMKRNLLWSKLNPNRLENPILEP